MAVRHSTCGRLGSPFFGEVVSRRSVVPERQNLFSLTVRRHGRPCAAVDGPVVPTSFDVNEGDRRSGRVDARQHVLQAVLDDVAAHYDVGRWWDVQPVASGFRIAAEAGTFLVAVSPRERSDASLLVEAM